MYKRQTLKNAICSTAPIYAGTGVTAARQNDVTGKGAIKTDALSALYATVIVTISKKSYA